MFDLHCLKTLVVLAKHRHFGQAAAELHMTQPNVTLQIKRLEAAAGVRLLERAPFKLTPAGERLLQSAESVLAELQLCHADLHMLDEQGGVLTVAASDIIARALLIAPFQRFKETFPQTLLSLHNSTSAEAAELVRSGRADIGFVLEQRFNEALHFSPLRDVHWLAIGAGRLRSEGEGDNRNLPPLILLGHETRSRALIEPILLALGWPQRRLMEVSSVDAQLDWAEAGFGIAIVPDFSLRSRKALQAPVQSLPELPPTALGYIVRQNQHLSKGIKALLNEIEVAVNVDK